MRNHNLIMPVQTGLNQILDKPPSFLKGCRLGLLCNPASVDNRLRHARDLINRRFPGQLAALYSPQHGFFAEKQDNMIESSSFTDPLLDIPVFSLYGQTRIPTPDMFAPIDVLLIDLQDVGTRVYTFVYTMSYCLETARQLGKKVVVLDRPNPIGGTQLEGNCLSPDCASFVGRFPIPMRHGMTIGEIAILFNTVYGIECDLTVIPMKGWRRWMYFEDTGLPWVPPSPNLPTPLSAVTYPGQVLWEGTNVSEGRGTTQPFEIFGAPFFDTDKISSFSADSGLKGYLLRPVVFEPCANKFRQKRCHGFQIHVTDRQRYQPYITSLMLLQAVCFHHPSALEWKPPPYEYEYIRWPVDLILGDKRIRQQVECNQNLCDIEASWKQELNKFKKKMDSCRIYA